KLANHIEAGWKLVVPHSTAITSVPPAVHFTPPAMPVTLPQVLPYTGMQFLQHHLLLGITAAGVVLALAALGITYFFIHRSRRARAAKPASAAAKSTLTREQISKRQQEWFRQQIMGMPVEDERYLERPNEQTAPHSYLPSYIYMVFSEEFRRKILLDGLASDVAEALSLPAARILVQEETVESATR